MSAQSYKTWWEVKGKITGRFGSVVACARKLECSEDGLRKAVEGKCPGIAERLKAELDYDWVTGQTLKEVAA
jgi:hypothetical protein